MHPACLPIEELLKACQVERLRAKGSGAGGQRKNKVATAVRITHTPTGCVGQAAERRDQEVNRKHAVFRLRVALALQERGWFELTKVPSVLLQSRIKDGALLINEKHADFPAVLAEVLDAMQLKDWDAARVGTLLGVRTSQVVKLLKKEPKALVQVNQQRQATGKPALR